MLILNQLIGSFLVHPDWDEAFRQSVRYVFLVVTLGATVYITEIKDLLDTAGGISYV